MTFPPRIRRIVLTGFMGAGKSTIGALLSRRLGWDFLDVDAVIEARAGKTIAEIFVQEGEAAFRLLESEAIRDSIQREDCVLALGGGAVESESTRELLAGLAQTRVVFLDAPLELLVARCLAQPGAAERPVLADREALVRRFAARLAYYRQAHVTVRTAELSPEETVERVLDAVAERAEIGPRRKAGRTNG